MNQHQQLAIAALNAMRGDDLYRARRRFSTYTPAQMQAYWGDSGKTCAELLAECEERDDAITAAIEWVKEQS